MIPSGRVRFLKTVLQDSFDGVSDNDDKKSFFFKNKQTLKNIFLYTFPKELCQFVIDNGDIQMYTNLKNIFQYINIY